MTKRLVFLVFFSLLALAAPAAGQEGSSLIQSVVDCRRIPLDRERLACFDRAAVSLDSARRDDGLVVMNRKEVREKRRSLFGLKLPDIDLFGRDEAKEPAITELDSAVLDARLVARDRWEIRLADKSIWRTTEPARVAPRVGDKVKIRRAALGSYRASFSGAYPVRIQRVE